MKPTRRALLVAVLVYVTLWFLSAIVVYPGRLIAAVDSGRKDATTHPTLLGRWICFAPGMFWVDWEQGSRAFDCSGWQGILVTTPFGTTVLWKRMAWIS